MESEGERPNHHIERGGLACRSRDYKEKARPKPGSFVLPVTVVAVDTPLIDPRPVIVIAGVVVIAVIRGVAVPIARAVIPVIVGPACSSRPERCRAYAGADCSPSAKATGVCRRNCRCADSRH